jgi:hypothetical protein
LYSQSSHALVSVGAGVEMTTRTSHSVAAGLLLPEKSLPESDRGALILDVEADVAGDRHGDGLERIELEILCFGPQTAGIDGGVGAGRGRRFDDAEPGDDSPFRKGASTRPDTGGLTHGAAGSGDDDDAGRQKD